MKNKVCEVLNIKYPIIQGAMAYTAMAPLVGAVSNAGGLGVLGSGFFPPPLLLEQIEKVRSITDQPFACNFFLDPTQMLDAQFKVAIDQKVPVAYLDTLNLLDYDFSKHYYDMVHEAGIKVVAKINCLHDALVAEKAGADVIITKGVEGGGHKAKISAMVLLAEVVERVQSIPIVASGGIVTPRQAAGCIVMGAQGVEMGTAFVATNEAPVHPNVKQRIVGAQDIDIVACGESTGEPSWQIRNKLSDILLDIEAKHLRSEAAELVRKASEGSLRIASLEGDVTEKGAVMGGQACALVHAVVPVSERVSDFCRQVEEILGETYSLNL